MENIIEAVKQIVHQLMQDHGIQVKQILLFGSRARSDFRKDSDWDFLVLIDRDLDFHGRWEIIQEIKRRLAKLKIPNDIIIKSESQFQKMKSDVGSIVYYVNKEGIEV